VNEQVNSCRHTEATIECIFGDSDLVPARIVLWIWLGDYSVCPRCL